MCQGHGDSSTEATNTPEPSASGQPAQTEQSRRQKAKVNKAQQKQQQNSRPQTPNPLPTLEIIKEQSVKLANGVQYVDVLLPRSQLTTDTLSHAYDRWTIYTKVQSPRSTDNEYSRLLQRIIPG